jgi:hypothetical protein
MTIVMEMAAMMKATATMDLQKIAGMETAANSMKEVQAGKAGISVIGKITTGEINIAPASMDAIMRAIQTPQGIGEMSVTQDMPPIMAVVQALRMEADLAPLEVAILATGEIYTTVIMKE